MIRLEVMLLGMLLGAVLPFFISGMVMLFTGAHMRIEIVRDR